MFYLTMVKNIVLYKEIIRIVNSRGEIMFFRTESFNEFIRYYPIVAAIIAINALLFLASFFPVTYDYVYRSGVGSNTLVAQGEYWRLVTPIFLHGSFTHFLFNSFSLFLFGPAMENILGKWKFLGLYLFAGIMGNVGTFIFGPDIYLHLGASGAIYGILGLYLYMVLYRQSLIDPQSSQIIKIMLVIGAVYSVVVPGINILAHLFGFIGGFIAGFGIFEKPSMPSLKRKKRRNKNLNDDGEVILFDPNRKKK